MSFQKQDSKHTTELGIVNHWMILSNNWYRYFIQTVLLYGSETLTICEEDITVHMVWGKGALG